MSSGSGSVWTSAGKSGLDAMAALGDVVVESCTCKAREHVEARMYLSSSCNATKGPLFSSRYAPWIPPQLPKLALAWPGRRWVAFHGGLAEAGPLQRAGRGYLKRLQNEINDGHHSTPRSLRLKRLRPEGISMGCEEFCQVVKDFNNRDFEPALLRLAEPLGSQRHVRLRIAHV